MLLYPSCSSLLLVLASLFCVLVHVSFAFQIPSHRSANHDVRRHFSSLSNPNNKRIPDEASLLLLLAKSKRRDDEEEEDEDASNLKQPGMEEAFRQLDALSSLGDDTTTAASSNNDKHSAAPKTIQVDTASTPDAPPASLESEIRVYQDMVGELETNEDAEAYSELLADMGSMPKQTENTYAQVMEELGGTPKELQKQVSSSSPESMDAAQQLPTTIPSSASDEMMEQALQEALQDVQVSNPDILSQRVLDDTEIMKEIEQIFEEGNAKLMSDLEEMRKDQQSLAAASAQRNAAQAAQETDRTADRLEKAQGTMRRVLDTVDVEQSNVQQAVADLQAAQNQIEQSDRIGSLRGNVPKQVALVGCILFAGRSFMDTIGAVQGNDGTVLTAALVQAAIALVFAVVFAVV